LVSDALIRLELMQIASQLYGKDRVRVLRVRRGPDGIHTVYEVEVSVALEGDFSATYLTGDNSKVVETDTMKNTVHVLAKKHLDDVLEEFPLALAHHFLERYPQVSRAVTHATSRPWDRYRAPDGAGHPHSFIGRATVLPFSRVDATREGTTVQSGVKDVLILKSADSAFVGYPRCEYTTLPETKDRILATRMEATWTFVPQASSYAKTNEAILHALLGTFAEEFSPSVQNTLFLMGSAALRAAPEISDIHLAMPNKHYLPIDFQPFHLENNNEIFLPTDEPHGQIEAHITR
jgi:urate oxidase